MGGGKYFIFDMDETLAELYSVYYFIASLRLKGTLEWVNKDEANNITESLNTSLNKAYNNFVEDVLSEEISTEPLGILRPGILDVMKRLYDLQKKGLVKHVLIYSNNGHLQSLEFIRDLIHKHLGTNNLIGECIHWNHHMRDEERVPGVANKACLFRFETTCGRFLHGACGFAVVCAEERAPGAWFPGYGRQSAR